MFQKPGANVPAYVRVSISNEMKEWIEATNLRFEHLYQQINLLQEQVQKSSLGFTVSVPDIKGLGDIKIDSITKDISHDIIIDPNPPKPYEEVAPSDSKALAIDVDDLVTLLYICESLLANMVLNPAAPYTYEHVADARMLIKDAIEALTHVREPYTQRDDK